MSKNMPSHAEIVQLLTREPMTTSQLRGRMGITKKQKMQFKSSLLAMVRAGTLARNNKKQFFVPTTEEKVAKTKSEQRPAARSRQADEKYSQNRIRKGMLFQENKQWMVRDPETRKTYQIPRRKQAPGELGQMVLFELYNHPKFKHEKLAKVVAGMGNYGTFAELVKQYQADHDLDFDFSPQVYEEVNALQAPTSDDFADRADFRSWDLLCIDPDGARDHDDAISVEKTAQGWKLGVHIADVSYYVQENGPLDHEAVERSFTQYLPWAAIPMLPARLSSDLCSLREGEDRLAFSCLMDLDAKGQVLHYEFKRSVVRVNRSITYEQAVELLTQKDPQVRALSEVARLLREVRAKSGILELDSTEYGVEFDAEGEPVQIVPRSNGESNSWIEECMLITNQCCARELQNRKLQGIYRIHEPPDVKDVTELRENEPDLFTRAPVSLQELSSARRSDSNLHEPGFRLYLHLVQKAKGNPAKINRILRSMQKAHYDSNPFGHWALNWQDYAHFTAPIRRYTDLWCHRELARSSAEAQEPRAHNVVELCDLISANEITIQKNERNALKVCAAWLLRERIGDEMTGTISGMEEWGVFVTLDDPPTDGLVRFRDLPGNDYWYFNREKSCVVGRRSRRTYFRGDKVVVQVLRVNPLKGEVDLAILARVDSAVPTAQSLDLEEWDDNGIQRVGPKKA